jgi:hypothetical protein
MYCIRLSSFSLIVFILLNKVSFMILAHLCKQKKGKKVHERSLELGLGKR